MQGLLRLKMGTIKNNIFKIFSTPHSTYKEVLAILFYIMKVQLLVWVTPLRFYFNSYFTKKQTIIPNMQLFDSYLRIYMKVLRILPFKLTCLVKSMVLYDVLKRHGIINPVHLGVRIEGNLKAHAWNDHQLVTDFKTII